MSIKDTIRAVKGALSAARTSTFEAASGVVDDTDPGALALYAWNARVSAALLAPLHVCEVVIRNTVSETLEKVYGPRWPWSIGFEQSLPTFRAGYNPRRDLQNARTYAASTGKAIPELKFVFWQKLFTSRYDFRLWDPYLLTVLPNLEKTKTVDVLRQEIYDDLEEIRKLRNRIAHHEPIFRRNLAADLKRIVTLVGHRCKLTEEWMMANQQASGLFRESPIFRSGNPSHEEIAQLAYVFWMSRVGNHAGADQDWRRAEKELKGAI